MKRSTYIGISGIFMCALLLMNLVHPAKSSTRGYQSPAQRVTGEQARFWNSPTMPNWLRWAESDSGRHVLHYSSHAAAPGLLKFAGEEPMITILPALTREVSEAASPAFTVTCNANGVQFNKEPASGDAKAPFMGQVQPYDKIGSSIVFSAGGGVGGSDFIVVGAKDARGLYGGLGGSSSLTVFHTTNAVSGTPDCTPNVEAALPMLTDSNGVKVSGMTGPSVAYDAATNTIIAGSILTGTASDGNLENAVGVFFSTPATIESTACANGAEGNTKNKSCWPKGFTITASELNRTANTGLLFGPVEFRVWGNGNVGLALGWVDTQSGDFNEGIAECPETATSASNCTPFTVFATGSTTNPLNGFKLVIGANGTAYIGYSQGDEAVQFPTDAFNLATCTPNTLPNAPSCVSGGTIADYVPVGNAPGFIPPIDTTKLLTIFDTFGGAISPTSPPTVAWATTECVGTFEPITTPAKTNECAQTDIGIWYEIGVGSYSKYTLPSMPGKQFLPGSISFDASANLYVPFLSTGTDTTGQSFRVNIATIPAGFGTPATITQVTPSAIDPSAGFSTGGDDWGPVYSTDVQGGSFYLLFDSTKLTGNWGPNTKQPKESDTIILINGP